MSYTEADATWDLVEMGKCPICRRYPADGCKHCKECGRVNCSIDHEEQTV